jgi:hypothetical protein
MGLCQLRAGLSRNGNSSAFVLGSPKAWLGTAYHEVLEKILSVDLSKEKFDVAVERLWNEAATSQYHRIITHSLNRRFGMPVTWPGYYLAKASVFLRARELVEEAVSVDEEPVATPDLTHARSYIREQTLTAFEGKLTGRPDAIRDRDIVDYKSGAIVETDEATQTEVAKAGYVRQLRIYGFLVKETLGWWPQHGTLLPVAGAGIKIRLNPDECTREAGEAVAILDAYNAKLNAAKSVDELASPKPENCKWCPFKILCPAFWNSVTAMWSRILDGAAVEGTIDEAPRAIHGGNAVALSLNVQSGTQVPARINLAPLDPNTHAAITTLSAGDRVRLVGLRERPDGSLLPTPRTVLARVDELPVIGLANSN